MVALEVERLVCSAQVVPESQFVDAGCQSFHLEAALVIGSGPAGAFLTLKPSDDEAAGCGFAGEQYLARQAESGLEPEFDGGTRSARLKVYLLRAGPPITNCGRDLPGSGRNGAEFEVAVDSGRGVAKQDASPGLDLRRRQIDAVEAGHGAPNGGSWLEHQFDTGDGPVVYLDCAR